MMPRYAALTRLRRRWRTDSGAELVEFALVLPVLLVLIVGVADFALLFHGYQVTTNAAREGARLAILPGYDANSYATVRARVREDLLNERREAAVRAEIARLRARYPVELPSDKP